MLVIQIGAVATIDYRVDLIEAIANWSTKVGIDAAVDKLSHLQSLPVMPGDAGRLLLPLLVKVLRFGFVWLLAD